MKSKWRSCRTSDRYLSPSVANSAASRKREEGCPSRTWAAINRNSTNDPINWGLTRWWLTIDMDAVAESGKNPASKHKIQPEFGG